MADALSAANPNPGAALASPEASGALVGLLQLQATVLASPPPLVGLRTIVDMIFADPCTMLVGVGVPAGNRGRVRYLAHAGRAEPAHQSLVTTATPIAAKAMHTGELVQMIHTEGGVAHTCIHVPIVGAEQVLGFFGVGMYVGVPIEPWREEIIWATSELMALLLLEMDEFRATQSSRKPSINALTARQREVLYELVAHGAGNAEIGRRLGISAHTIKIHLMAAFRQLGLRNRADAIRYVLTEHADWLVAERARLPAQAHGG